ncbi:MAG TPA: hypothetical protein VGG38_06520 [Acidimicrobiales bacterium]
MAAFFGGILVAIYFGRKATVSVSATASHYDGRVALAVRPSVTAIGYFKFRIRESIVSAVEMVRVVADGPLVENQDEPWEVIGVFGNQFAFGGETLATTTVVDAGEPPESVAGWQRLGR